MPTRTTTTTTTPHPIPTFPRRDLFATAVFSEKWSGDNTSQINAVFSRDLPDVELPPAYLADLTAAVDYLRLAPPPANHTRLVDAYVAARQADRDPVADPAVIEELTRYQLVNARIGDAVVARAANAWTQAVADHAEAIIDVLLQAADQAAEVLRTSRTITEVGPDVRIDANTKPAVFTAWAEAGAAMNRFSAAAGIWVRIVRGLRLAPRNPNHSALIYADLDADQLDAANDDRRIAGPNAKTGHQLAYLTNHHPRALGLTTVAGYTARVERVAAQRQAKQETIARHDAETYAARHPTPPQAIPPELRAQQAEQIAKREPREHVD